MAQVGAVVEAGQARDGYRLRLSSTARTALGAEWDRCRWDASFVVPAQVEPLPQTGRALGVDPGVQETATTTSDAVEDFRPKFLAKSTMARKAAVDCAHCDARAQHRLPLGERTYTCTCACTACETVSPRDKDSARVMLVRAGPTPAGFTCA